MCVVVSLTCKHTRQTGPKVYVTKLECHGFVVELTVPDDAMQVCVWWAGLLTGG